MAAHQDGSKPLKTAICNKLNADLSADNIYGLTEIPLVFQQRPPTSFDGEYIYIESPAAEEVDKTKYGSAIDYSVMIQVLVRSRASESATRTRDDIVNEIRAIIDVEPENYIDIDEYNLYIQNVDDVHRYDDETGGATYNVAAVMCTFRMSFTGESRVSTPIQSPIYSYSSFQLTPHSNLIEEYDDGSITGANSYSTPNNSWTFSSASYALASGSDGSISGRVVTVGTADSDIDITSTLTYTKTGESNQVLTRTTEFNRVKSVRFGAITPGTAGTQPTFLDNTDANVGLRNLATFDTAKRNFSFRRTNPRNHSYQIDGAVAGDFIYFIYDENQPSLNSIIHNVQGGGTEEVLNDYNSLTVGGYKIYIQKRALSFAGDYNFTLS